jgi:hypothetical protein
MKKIVLLAAAVAALLFTSCEKNNNTPTPSNSAILGSWEPTENCVSVNYQLEGESIVIPDFTGEGQDIIITTDDIDQMLNEELLWEINSELTNEDYDFVISQSDDATNNIYISIFYDGDLEMRVPASDNGSTISFNIPFEIYEEPTPIPCTFNYTVNDGKLTLRAGKEQILDFFIDYINISATVEGDEEYAELIAFLIEGIAEQIKSIELEATFIKK